MTKRSMTDDSKRQADYLVFQEMEMLRARCERLEGVVRRGLALVDSINRVDAYSSQERVLANNWLAEARVLLPKVPKV